MTVSSLFNGRSVQGALAVTTVGLGAIAVLSGAFLAVAGASGVAAGLVGGAGAIFLGGLRLKQLRATGPGQQS